jgi:D-glycero-D-manno-heptose 1,7-bisphosphate phosphatase
MTLSSPKVVLLDRDGVINLDVPGVYVTSIEQWKALPGSLEAIARLHNSGFKLGIVTNQSAVGRGMMSVDTLWGIHRYMLQHILNAGGFVQRIFFCLHTPEDNCDCRKPKPGLLQQAAEYFASGFDNMIFIGDKRSDVEAARAVGARPILVRTGQGSITETEWEGDDLPEIYDDLYAVTEALIQEQS